MLTLLRHTSSSPKSSAPIYPPIAHLMLSVLPSNTRISSTLPTRLRFSYITSSTRRSTRRLRQNRPFSHVFSACFPLLSNTSILLSNARARPKFAPGEPCSRICPRLKSSSRRACKGVPSRRPEGTCLFCIPLTSWPQRQNRVSDCCGVQ